MEAVLIYLVKASGILTLFFGVYQLFLKKETFFEANRHFLLGGILAAFLCPFVEITRYVTEESLPVSAYTEMQAVGTNTILANNGMDWMGLIIAAYLTGVAVLSVKFLIQLLSLRKLVRRHPVRKMGAIRYVETSRDLAPFSFFNYVFYNPRQFSADELQAIRQHEKAHCIQKHSVDVLVAHLMTIVLWINPLSWFYRHTLQQNLEFLADSSAVRCTKSVKKYQYALLKVSAKPITTPITNNFYNSLIKKRIVMLHKSRSNQLQALKFAIILPLLAGFVLTFNTKVVAQEKEKNVEIHVEKIEIRIDKDYTMEQMESDMAFMKERGINLKFKGVRRNSAGEITAINASYKDERGISGNYSQNGDQPINPFSFRVSGEGDERRIGFFSGTALHESHAWGGNNTKKIIVEIDDDEDENGAHEKHVIREMHFGDEDEVHWVGNGEGEDMEVLVEIKDGEKVITINGEQVSEEELEEFGNKADGKKIRIKKLHKGQGGNVFIMKDADAEEDIEIIEGSGNGFFFLDSASGEEPLFIVDGKEMSREAFKEYAPSQIEKIEVLKGEAALEKYGDRAKDGVIVVTTKKE